MSMVLSQIENPPLVLHLRPAVEMTDRQFFDFCRINRDLRIERTAEGDIEIMTPAGEETGARNSQINLQLGQWAKKDRRGVVFDSSTGFTLPKGATRSPDAAWVERSRLTALTQEQKEVFLPLCPDFVIELRSPSEPLATLQSKMQEYLDNGAQLGWLIDTANRRLLIYRQSTDVECLDNPAQVSGAPILTGFILSLEEIWEPGF